MTEHEVARQVMRDRNYSQAELAVRAGAKSQSAVSMWLSGKSMRVDSLLKILNACDYDLIVRSRDNNGKEYLIGDEPVADIPAVECTGNSDMEDMIRRIVAEELRKAGTTPTSDE